MQLAEHRKVLVISSAFAEYALWPVPICKYFWNFESVSDIWHSTLNGWSARRKASTYTEKRKENNPDVHGSKGIQTHVSHIPTEHRLNRMATAARSKTT
jgi:hypothetical protein